MTPKKRIILIRPGKRFPRINFAPPLGLLSLIAVLRQRYPEQFEIDLVEQALYDISPQELRRRMEEFKPDLVVISCMSVEANEMREAAAIAKELSPPPPVWIGGPHASQFFDWELETGNVDAVCIGEGEQTFIEMLEAWLAGQELDRVAGLALWREGRAVLTPAREYIADLDSLPFPAWDLVDFNKYARQISMNGFIKNAPWAMIFSSRGCPYNCKYCHNLFGKRVRWRGVEHVMEEIELLHHQHGVRELHIVDDIFNLDLPRAKTICDEIVRRGIKVSIAFPNGLRGDRMDRELIQKLKAAGCYSVTYAIETASPRLQKAIKKNADLDKLKQVIAWSDEEGLITQGFFMLGFPGETREEMETTVAYALDTRLARANFFTVVVYPRTGLFEMARTEYPEFDFSGYDFFSFRYFAEETFYARVTGVDLSRIQRRAYRRFYLRPAVILKFLIRFPKNLYLLHSIFWALRWAIAPLVRIEARLQPFRKWLGRHVSVFAK